MKLIATLAGLLPVIAMILLSATPADAAVTLPWTTTYNCGDWTRTANGLYNVNCDSLKGAGAWDCTNSDSTTEEEQITSAANNPGGDGGSGQRHWEGPGVNNNSGGLAVDFLNTQSDLRIRWYMKFAAGFAWNALYYDKLLYIHTDLNGTDVIPIWYGSNKFSVYAQSGGGHYFCSDCGWNHVMGSSTSDDQWHAYELHIVMDTNGSNGVVEFWIDSIKVIDRSDADLGTRPGWTSFGIGINQKDPAGSICRAVDFDDFKVTSGGGYIGLLSDTLAPASPTPPVKQ